MPVAQLPTGRSKIEQAAQQFEAIFLRQLLAPLEKSTSLTGDGDASSKVYGAMLVGSFADSASQNGGIGLAEMVLEAFMEKTPKSEKSPEPA